MELIAIQDRLRKEATRRERRRARTVFVGNNRETEMANVAEIKALFFALISGALKKELEIGAPKLNAQVGNFMVSTIFGTNPRMARKRSLPSGREKDELALGLLKTVL